MIIQELYKEKLISPPSFLPSNMAMLAITGSMSYGCNTDDSDLDMVGVCVPPKNYLFPTAYGEIEGFGYQRKRFEQWQNHHVKYKDKEYDFSVYNIAKYFHLVMDGNPNMVDVLFVPRECIVFSTRLWEKVRENRHIFLSKKMWPRFKGYSYSQISKMSSNKREGKRKKLYDEYGFDVKFGYNVVRLLLEVEQILAEGDLDLQRHKEQLKSIRKGEWTENEIKEWASEKEKDLEKLYHDSELRYSPNEEAIKSLLLECIKIHYGEINECRQDNSQKIISELEKIVERYR